MHSNTDMKEVQIPSRRLTLEEIQNLQKEGLKYLSLPYIPRGERNFAIYAVAQYAFTVLGMGYGREEERREFLVNYVLDRRSFRSRGAERHTLDVIDRCVTWTPHQQSERRSYKHLSERVIDRMVETKMTLKLFLNANKKKSWTARQKIQEAYQKLVDEGITVTQGKIVRLTGCSVNTVKKHQDIWKIFDKGVSHEIMQVGVQGEGDKALRVISISRKEKDGLADLVTADNPSFPCANNYSLSISRNSIRNSLLVFDRRERWTGVPPPLTEAEIFELKKLSPEEYFAHVARKRRL